MANILLGVSGGIAAYKALELVRLATGAGHSVRVIQTRASTRFVGPASFEGLTGAPVLAGGLELDPARGAFPGEQLLRHDPIAHLELARKADVYLIAPASANTIAKLAHGFASDMLSSAALAADCPLLLAPAMNDRMYAHAATQANLRLLRERGTIVLDPGSGRLASAGEHGIGRMQEPRELLAACERALAGSAAGPTSDLDGTLVAEEPLPGRSASDPDAAPEPQGAADWEGLRVLVTAGGTREPIDGVRFVGNSSSGRMGLALAQAARDRGASVTVIAANVALSRPDGVAWQQAPTAEQMRLACERELPRCDVLLMAAAVADFRPAAPVEGKIKKGGRQRLCLELEPTADVLSGLAQRRGPGQTLVGFAAEHGEGAIEEARRKLRDKRIDAIVLNDVSRGDIGFESDSNEVVIVGADFELAVAKAAKRAIAEAVLDAVMRLRAAATPA
ncbi:MAG: bifunctional phosphopantothenoylcysteine decarboxylase/phosphopantothenate synthase [Solirubrobacteraceae bacterium]